MRRLSLLSTTLAALAAGAAVARGIPGCVAVRGMVNPVTVAFAGGGRDLYVGSLGNGALVQLHRDARSGRLSRIAGAPHCWGAQLGCTRPPGEQTMPAGIAVPGDERHVYVTGADNLREEDAVGVAGYVRDGRSGALRPLPQGVVCPRPARAPAGDCLAPRGGLADVDLVATRDGRFLYGASEQGIIVLRRDPATGALSQPDGAGGCLLTDSRTTQRQVDLRDCAVDRTIGVVRDLALSPDGAQLYVAAEPDDGRGGGLTVLRRDAGSGALTVTQTLRRGFADEGAINVTLTPGAAYATDSDFAVHVLRRARSDGRLTQLRGRAGCVSVDPRCTFPRASSSPEEIAVTPNGRAAFLADASALDLFARAGSGALRQARGAGACHTRDGTDGLGGGPRICVRSGLKSLRAGLGGLAVTPDGRHLIVLGTAAAFGRAAGVVEVARIG
jgi:DNA-binding beta-propeller fold protein YncE